MPSVGVMPEGPLSRARPTLRADFCNQRDPRARPRIARTLVCTLEVALGARLGKAKTPPTHAALGAEAPWTDATGEAETSPIEEPVAACRDASPRDRVCTRAARHDTTLRSTSSSDQVAPPVYGSRQPRGADQGPDRLSPHRHSTAIARAWGYPNRALSDTFCRERVALPAGEADEAELPDDADISFDAPTGRTPLSR
jgi:hypothetical protein